MRVDRGAGRTGRRVAALRVSRSLVVAGLCGVVGATAVAAQEAPSAEAAVVDGGGGTGLTEREAVALALERNRELVEARLGLEAAESQVREAWGAVYPHLSVSTTYMRNLTVPSSFLPAVFLDPEASPDELIPVQFGADNNWTLDLRLEQPIFEAQAFIGVGAADRYRRLQRESVRGMAEEIATRVRIAYHDVLLAGERVRLSELALERIRRTLEETRALREAGMASEYDVLRLEVQLANLEPDLRRARNGHAAAKRALTVELGMRPTDTLTVAGSLLDVEPGGPAAGAESLAFTGLPEPTSLPVERVVRMAVERRSDLRQLLLTENLRHAELRVAQTEYLPTVSLFGTYSINTQENDSPDFFGGSEAPRAYGRQIGIQVSVPIFSGFQRPARVGRRRAELRRAEVQYERARAEARNEVETLLEQIDETRARAEGQRRAVEQARRGFEIARSRHREGIGSRLEVTDAEVALRQSEVNYAQAVYEHVVARARLDRAVGRVPLVDAELDGSLDR